MDAGVIELARPRRGHFELGTGYHGDVWLDLDALFLRPALLQPHVEWLAGRLREHQVDAVCGPLEGGAFLALALATRLGVAFLPGYRAPAGPGAAAPVRPAAAAPAGPGGGPAVGYRLPAVPGGIGGWRVAIADDAVNAGTAVRACAAELHQRGAGPAAVAALLALGPAHATVKQTLALPLYAAGQLDSQAWPAGTCPLCASGAPLTDPE
ncbi:MAG TPA: phosphoribosyltransferase [Streptosporangiaceae bacterium]